MPQKRPRAPEIYKRWSLFSVRAAAVLLLCFGLCACPLVRVLIVSACCLLQSRQLFIILY